VRQSGGLNIWDRGKDGKRGGVNLEKKRATAPTFVKTGETSPWLLRKKRIHRGSANGTDEEKERREN